MPSQAEFDPILENASRKLDDFAAALREFKSEAASLDKDGVGQSLKSINETQKVIESAQQKGMSMSRALAILTSMDDVALDAARWESPSGLEMSRRSRVHQDAGRLFQFGVSVHMNLTMLREVGQQFSHPALRLAVALDELVDTLVHK